MTKEPCEVRVSYKQPTEEDYSAELEDFDFAGGVVLSATRPPDRVMLRVGDRAYEFKLAQVVILGDGAEVMPR